MKNYSNGRELVEEHQKAEVSWYKARGMYSGRIRRDALGCEYVIGDATWNFGLPPTEREVVEPVMRIFIGS